MSYLTSGFAEIIFRSRQAAGYREQITACGFAIAGWDPGDIALIGMEWDTFLDATGRPTTSVNGPLTVRVGTADPSAPLVYEDTSTPGGSGSATLPPPNVSMLVTKTTLLGGRAGRGRMFMPSPLESSIDNTGAVDSTYRDNYQSALDTMVAAIEVLIGGSAYLLHSEASPAPTLIQTFRVESRVATQRRRLRS